MRLDAKGNWLHDILDPNSGYFHVIHNLNGLSVAAAQAALDAQHGRDRFEVRDHGTVHVVYDLRKYEDRTGKPLNK